MRPSTDFSKLSAQFGIIHKLKHKCLNDPENRGDKCTHMHVERNRDTESLVPTGLQYQLILLISNFYFIFLLKSTCELNKAEICLEKSPCFCFSKILIWSVYN